jgi:hypothetical protein
MKFRKSAELLKIMLERVGDEHGRQSGGTSGRHRVQHLLRRTRITYRVERSLGHQNDFEAVW